MSSVPQYPKSDPYWAPKPPYHLNNRTGSRFQTEKDNSEKLKHAFDLKARKETGGGGVWGFLFFKQYLNSALYLNCLRPNPTVSL